MQVRYIRVPAYFMMQFCSKQASFQETCLLSRRLAVSRLAPYVSIWAIIVSHENLARDADHFI